MKFRGSKAAPEVLLTAQQPRIGLTGMELYGLWGFRGFYGSPMGPHKALGDVRFSFEPPGRAVHNFNSKA